MVTDSSTGIISLRWQYMPAGGLRLPWSALSKQFFEAGVFLQQTIPLLQPPAPVLPQFFQLPKRRPEGSPQTASVPGSGRSARRGFRRSREANGKRTTRREERFHQQRARAVSGTLAAVSTRPAQPHGYHRATWTCLIRQRAVLTPHPQKTHTLSRAEDGDQQLRHGISSQEQNAPDMLNQDLLLCGAAGKSQRRNLRLWWIIPR